MSEKISKKELLKAIEDLESVFACMRLDLQSIAKDTKAHQELLAIAVHPRSAFKLDINARFAKIEARLSRIEAQNRIVEP